MIKGVSPKCGHYDNQKNRTRRILRICRGLFLANRPSLPGLVFSAAQSVAGEILVAPRNGLHHTRVAIVQLADQPMSLAGAGLDRSGEVHRAVTPRHPSL